MQGAVEEAGDRTRAGRLAWCIVGLAVIGLSAPQAARLEAGQFPDNTDIFLAVADEALSSLLALSGDAPSYTLLRRLARKHAVTRIFTTGPEEGSAACGDAGVGGEATASPLAVDCHFEFALPHGRSARRLRASFRVCTWPDGAREVHVLGTRFATVRRDEPRATIPIAATERQLVALFEFANDPQVGAALGEMVEQGAVLEVRLERMQDARENARTRVYRITVLSIDAAREAETTRAYEGVFDIERGEIVGVAPMD